MNGFSARTIHLSSKYANDIAVDSSGNAIRYIFQLSQAVSLPQEYELIVSVLSASIPYTWYSVPLTVLNYGDSDTGAVYNWGVYDPIARTFSGNLPAGNYTPTDIINFLGGTMPTGNNVDINISFNVYTGRFSFTNIHPSRALVIPITPVLGITRNLSLTPGTTAVAQSVPSIFGTQFINVVTNLATNNLTAGSVPKDGGDVLLGFPVNASPFQLINYSPNNLLKNILKESTINMIEVTICDTNLQPLVLNGGFFEIDLLVECTIPADLPQKFSAEPSGLNMYALNRDYKFRR